ncbi:uncharacterized protein LOC131250807 isoform X2 [Magnolia sinica]|uniref:uncharacterized protein LOC131250807 isoform X2 n=1 Tax=Magnolia sinica TaxID=86752 RepID=UPI00265AE581|nr:uncharacterized protein LOC131250807 isoform X2 [Magnolia sinica]
MQDIPPEELHTPTETLELPVVGKGPMPSAQNDDSQDDNDGDDVWGEDGSFYNVSDDGSGKTSDLDREWERRHNQFHTMASRQVKKLLHKRVSLSALSSLCLSGTNGAMLEVSPVH